MGKDESPFSRKPYLLILRADVKEAEIMFDNKVEVGLVTEFRLRPCEPDVDHLPADAVVGGGSLIFRRLLFGMNSVERRKNSDHI